MKIVSKEKCYICGLETEFYCSDSATLLRDAVCKECGGTIRNSDVARQLTCGLLKRECSLNECIDKLDGLRILNTCSSGAIHNKLKNCIGYVASEYMDDVRNGAICNGIVCVDLMDIPFPNGYFDAIITEDVLEHVDDYTKALTEIYNKLSPGGIHIFTVPVHENRITASRTGRKDVYHGDPLRSNGILVKTDFGNDMVNILKQIYDSVSEIKGHVFYKPEDITDVDVTYDEYLQKLDRMEEYYKYNSIVYVCQKDGELILKSHPKICNSDFERYNDVYDYRFYLTNNPDVLLKIGDDPVAVFEHFLQYGMKEGRQGSRIFNPRIYRDKYEDLRATFGEDYCQYYYHFINYGKNEGRIAQ